MDGSAAALLFEARTRASLTQTALAERAGVTQSVISAYEAGRRQPSLPMLTGLIAAAGFGLELRLVDPTVRLTGPLGRRVRKHRRRIRALVASHDAELIGVFGSVARGEDLDDSDVDLLVDASRDPSLFTLGRLTESLEALLDARVDLVPVGGVKRAMRSHIDADLVRL